MKRANANEKTMSWKYIYKLHGKCVFRNNLPKKKELNIIWFFLFSSTKVERSRWVCSLYVCIYRNDYGMLHNESESKHNSDPKRYMPTHFMQRKRSCMNEWTNNNHKHSLLAHCVYSFRWPFIGYNFFFHDEKLCPLLATNSCWLVVYILLGVFVCDAIFGFLLKIVPLSRKIIGFIFRLFSLSFSVGIILLSCTCKIFTWCVQFQLHAYCCMVILQWFWGSTLRDSFWCVVFFSSFVCLFISFQCTRFLWYLIAWSNTIKIYIESSEMQWISSN